MDKDLIKFSCVSSRFVIQNAYEKNKLNNQYYELVKYLKNKIQNDTYESISNFINQKIGKLNKEKEIVLIDKEVPRWINTIKGDEEKSYYPAKYFYEKIIPNYFRGYEFVQKLVMPEANINEIVGIENKIFEGQHVDFYIPVCNLVIEIDGYHHRSKAQKSKDNKRDEYLLKYNIKTVRIKTIEIRNKNKSFDKKVKIILNQLEEYDYNLALYKQYYNVERYSEEDIRHLRVDAVIRLKMAMLLFIERGIISMSDENWRFNILTRDINDFVEIAVEDLFIDIENYLKIYRTDFKRPSVKIIEISDKNEFTYKEGYVNIDFSLNKRWTDENSLNNNIIFVRTDYY
ncbi:MAG: endonuclease domain-containing protein [Peptostreptococcaceae bacterium]